MIFCAKERHPDAVKEVVRRTISEVYPHYYPAGAVAFFLAHHKEENILSDIKKGIAGCRKKTVRSSER